MIGRAVWPAALDYRTSWKTSRDERTAAANGPPPRTTDRAR